MLNKNDSAKLLEFCFKFGIAEINCTCEDGDIREGFAVICKRVYNRVELISVTDTLIVGILVTIISIFGLVGNGLILTVAWKNRRNYLICQKLIAVLAGSDCIFSIFQLVNFIPKMWTNKWIYSETTCKVLFSGTCLGGVLAIGFIVVICIERFIGVVKPMYDSYKVISSLCVLNIFWGIITVIPLMIYYKISTYNFCVESWPYNSSGIIYHSYLLAMTFILPVITVMILYGIIVKKLRTGLFDTSLREAMEGRLYKKRVRETRRVIKIVLGLIVAFILFVGPTRVSFFLLQTNSWSPKIYRPISIVSLVMYSFHVAINPILYSVIDVRWRIEFKKIFIRHLPRKLTFTNGYSNSPQSSLRKMTRAETPLTLEVDFPATPSLTVKSNFKKLMSVHSQERSSSSSSLVNNNNTFV